MIDAFHTGLICSAFLIGIGVPTALAGIALDWVARKSGMR